MNCASSSDSEPSLSGSQRWSESRPVLWSSRAHVRLRVAVGGTGAALRIDGRFLVPDRDDTVVDGNGAIVITRVDQVYLYAGVVAGVPDWWPPLRAGQPSSHGLSVTGGVTLRVVLVRQEPIRNLRSDEDGVVGVLLVGDVEVAVEVGVLRLIRGRRRWRTQVGRIRSRWCRLASMSPVSLSAMRTSIQSPTETLPSVRSPLTCASVGRTMSSESATAINVAMSGIFVNLTSTPLMEL